MHGECLPLIIHLGMTATQGLDPRVFLTVNLLGANSRQQLWLIVREARFTLMAGVVLGFGRIISEVGIAMM